MAKAYRLTSRRKVALRKAQLISARKRKGKGGMSRRKRNVILGVTGVSAVALTGSAAYARHKISGSSVHGPLSRDITPMIKIAGVEVPGTRAGMRLANYGGKDGFALNYTSRNSKGDRIMFGYRHVPLTMEALKASFGRKVKGGPADASQWKPPQAFPEKIDMDIIGGFTTRTGRSKGGRESWSLGAFTPKINARRRTRTFRSTAQRQNDAKRITALEVDARLAEYQRILIGRGTIPNQTHLFKVARALREQSY